MIFLFIVNVIVLTLVAREFCQKVTEETPSEGREEEEKKTRELPAVELTTEEELVTKKSGQEGTQETPSQTTGTEEEEETKGPINTKTDEEKLKENSRRETSDEPGQAQKRTDSDTGKEGNKEDSAKLPKEQKPSKTEETDVIAAGVSSPQGAKALPEESVQQSKPFYELKAALTAMWLPAVVGNKKNLFIAASLSTLITKMLMLLVSIVLAFLFQEKLHPHPFILWSRVGKTSDC